MFRTLYCKIGAVLLGLFSLIFLFYILATLFTTRLHFQELNQRLHSAMAKSVVAEKILIRDGRVNDAALRDVFHMLMVVNPAIEVYLLDSDGAILAFDAPASKIRKRTVSLEPVKRYLDKTGTFPIFGDDPRDPDRKKVFSAAPIALHGKSQGYLYVILGGEEFDTVAKMLQGSYILRLSIGAAAGGLLFALLTALLLFSTMTRRLQRLTGALEAFRRSEFSETPLLPRKRRAGLHDEIDRLEAIFGEMAGRIIHQISDLRQADTLRREFVSHIAHDLRTPLTSLQGYLDTLRLKEGDLTPEQSREYLAIALKRSDQLRKLVADLFELAKLDSPDLQVRPEPFSLGELIQDVTQKFKLTAEEKRIQLLSGPMGNLRLVVADIGLIERVFENLIQNALRHTPENGTITVSAVYEGGKITVLVSDTGSGIRPEDLPHVFERFYGTSRSRRDTTTSGGLGLAITKKILELHGSDITVESTINVGTTFIFTLPAHQTQ
jgi:two-component system OmpR family sensor kinase